MADLREGEQDGELLGNTSKPPVASEAEETTQKQGTKPIAPQGRGIVIHLTSPANSEDWANLEEREPPSSVGRGHGGGTSSVEKEGVSEVNVHFPLECPSLALPTSSLPSSPSVSGFFGELFFHSMSSPMSSSLSSSSSSESTPFLSLVKSLSTEMECMDSSSLKPKPLVNLVKSISTDVSRQGPEVAQSKSDSKLNVHLWRQLTLTQPRQGRGRGGDCKTAPPSPQRSPTEGQASFFKVAEDVEARLEDTRRKLSEAMQEPLNMLSKMMGDEGGGGSGRFRPPHCNAWTADTPSPTGWDLCSHGGAASKTTRLTADMLKAERKEGDRPANSAHRSPPGRRGEVEGKQRGQCPSGGADDYYEICSFGDLLQIVETKPREDRALCGQGPPASSPRGTSFTPQSPPKVPSKALACFATLAYSYLVFPLPAFLSGLYLGLACGFMAGLLIISLHTPRRSQHACAALRSQQQIQPDSIMREPKDPEVVKGWMNEIYSYNPETYHPSLTFSVFVTLEGTALKLSYPRSNLPRRATFDEGKHDVVFISHRSCDLADGKVFLVPLGLAKKRIWNKKYPICIFLCESETIKSRCSGDRKIKTDSDTEDPEITPQDFQLRTLREGRENILFLFGRTGREKEEWFRYFLLASRVQSDDRQNHSRGGASNLGSSPSGRLACSDSSSDRDSTEDLPSLFKTKELAGNIKQKILLDYSRYMSKLIVEDGCSPLLSPNHSTASSPTKNQMPSSGEPHVSWINALIGRIFWDFLREKYWADLVANKIQKKLSKIRLPYFMNELALTELDLGALLPTIIHTSSPLVNPRGLWVDLEMTYNGALQMTLETKMNLCKLGKEFLPEGVNLADAQTERSKPRTLVLTDSDEESSSAGSSDEEEVSTAEMQGTAVDKLGSAGAEGKQYQQKDSQVRG
ncbi:testis-expressed protein 2 isoform X2 [Rhinoraja longicauda]